MSRTYIQRVSKELSHTIYYRFTCEQCGKDSNWLPYTITGTGICEGGYIKVNPTGEVSDETKRQVIEEAQKKLSNNMKTCRKATDKDVYRFSEKCQHCRKSQSWQGKGGLMISIGKGLGVAFVGEVSIMLLRYFFKLPISNNVHGIITVASVSIAMIVEILSRLSIKIRTKDVKNKKKPEINWNNWKF